MAAKTIDGVFEGKTKMSKPTDVAREYAKRQEELNDGEEYFDRELCIALIIACVALGMSLGGRR